jgi:hypothetical protein
MNDGSADNLSFVLAPSQTRIRAHGFAELGWTVEFPSRLDRNYVLERSPDLAEWVEATELTPGTGRTMTLFDTNAIAIQAFYRIACRPP